MSTVLIVEDEPDIRECMTDILRDHGYQVDTAANGMEALEMILANPKKYGLILLDLIMPIMTGPALLDQMAREGITIPTVIISGARRLAEYSNFRWLPKPFDLSDLEKTVAECLVR